jgi:hypothetical protein
VTIFKIAGAEQRRLSRWGGDEKSCIVSYFFSFSVFLFSRIA